MEKAFVAKATTTIAAQPTAVWDALTRPDLIRRYLYGTQVTTDWQVGSPITWTGEWKGRSYVDKGTVLAVEPERLLKTTHWSPLGGTEDTPENYHTVTYELAGDGDVTTLTLTQDNNATQEQADAMAENNWGPVLQALKETAEK